MQEGREVQGKSVTGIKNNIVYYSHVLGQLLSLDDVIISQLNTISQLFSSYPPSGAFCQVSE